MWAEVINHEILLGMRQETTMDTHTRGRWTSVNHHAPAPHPLHALYISSGIGGKQVGEVIVYVEGEACCSGKRGRNWRTSNSNTEPHTYMVAYYTHSIWVEASWPLPLILDNTP